MKDYKVGDTIYVKGVVKQIDEDDTALPYCVDFENGTVWISSDNIIDELPTAEPAKPVLPKEVADEMEKAKQNDLNFYGYLKYSVNGDFKLTWNFTFFVGDTDSKIALLLYAWTNGYTVEKEKKYNLILGTDTDGDTSAFFKNNPCTDAVLCIDADTYADDLKRDKFYQFTQEEIDKYNKDFWIKNIDLNDYKVEVPADED